MKNMVIVNDFAYTQGGASRIAIDTANLLADKMRVFFFCGDSGKKTELNDNITVVATNQVENLKNRNIVFGMRNGIFNQKAYDELEKLLDDLGDETIVHIHGWTKILSASIFQAVHDSGKESVVTLHDYFTICPNGGLYNYKRDEICPLRPMSEACKKCNCDSRNYFFKLYRVARQEKQEEIFNSCNSLKNVITISEFSEKIFRKYLKKNTKIYRIYNPIRTVPEDEVNNDNMTGSYYLFVGRLSHEKGVDIFCEALTRAKKDGVVVGDGKQLSSLKGRYPNISFVGWKNDEDVQRYMKNAKALIFPSRLYETAGLTVLEAQSIGLPCIVPQDNASSEFITNGSNGFLYDGSIDGLLNAIGRFEGGNQNSYRKESRISFKKYSSNVNDYVKQLLLVYNDIQGREK